MPDNTDRPAPENVAGAGRMPEFLIIGAAKSATTSLFHHMLRHPRVFGPRDKEPCFFSDDDVYARGLDWYKRLFAPSRPDQLCGEGSTNYTRWPQLPEAPSRIAKHLPDVRMIYLMRHPVDRAYSHYVHRYTVELHPGQPIRASFEEHVKTDPMCLDSSLYMAQIERYLDHFPRSSFLFLLSSDLERELDATLSKVFAFIGVDPAGVTGGRQSARESNEGAFRVAAQTRYSTMKRFKRLPLMGALARRMPASWKDAAYGAVARTPYGRKTQRMFTPPRMKPETRAELLRFFEGPNAKLAAFLGRDLSKWSV